MTPIVSLLRKSESGQAVLEFVLTLILLMTSLFFFVHVAFIFAWGNYVHYATFMSARAYLASGPSQADQKERASQVLVRMVKKNGGGQDRFPLGGKGFDGDTAIQGAYIGSDPLNSSGYERNLSWMEGVRYKYRSRLHLLPSSAPNAGGQKGLVLTSESWLGREPSQSECQTYMQTKGGAYDNGC